jgi:hypothetical protein
LWLDADELIGAAWRPKHQRRYGKRVAPNPRPRR